MGVSGPCSCFALVQSAERLQRGRVGVSLALAHAAGSCLFPQPGNPLTFRRGEEPRTPLTPARSFGKRRPRGQTGSPRGAGCAGARVPSVPVWGQDLAGPPWVGQSRETSPKRAAGCAGSKARLPPRRPAAAARAMAAPPARFLCRGRFPIDPALPLLGTSPLGGGKHGTYQNLGDCFPALWTWCQDRSKSHVAMRYREKSLRGSRREMQELGELRGQPVHPLLALGASPASSCHYGDGHPRKISNGAGTRPEHRDALNPTAGDPPEL